MPQCGRMNLQFFSPLATTALWLFLLLSVVPIGAHSRWKCPAPRNPETGIKTGPCGPETNNFSLAEGSDSIIELQPGPLRVYFEESIYHTGAPFRIALSGDGTDDEVCVLLDHIPHNDNLSSFPNIFDPATYTPYSVTINIPNVQCERCSLHLVNPMTDKIGDDGAPNGVGCTDPNGSCFSVYHSCTVPFRILGSIPRADYSCPAFPSDWPTQWTGDGGVSVPASVPGVYRRESSVWSSDGLLQTAPEQYRLDAGGLCGPPPNRIWWCISGESLIQVPGKSAIRMDELMIGESVLAANGKFTQVYSFGHKDLKTETEFIQIYSNASTHPLEITNDHMVYLYFDAISTMRLVPARDLKVGDLLYTQDGHAPAQVTKIGEVSRIGAYAPFTMLGSLLVNGIAVSNYIALPPTLVQGNNILESYEHQHRLQHAAYMPYRIYCGLFGCEGERYDDESCLSKAVMFWIPVLHWLEHLDKLVHRFCCYSQGILPLHWPCTVVAIALIRRWKCRANVVGNKSSR